MAFGLLASKEFPEVSFTYAAFLGPFLGAGVRPFGGWLSDKIDSGSKVTFVALIGMFIASIFVLIGIESHSFGLFFATFLVPKIFGWSYASFGSVSQAFYILSGFTFLTILITWYFYVRKGAGMHC